MASSRLTMDALQNPACNVKDQSETCPTMSPDLSKQFSLDYLLSGSNANAPVESVRNNALDSTIELLSQPILRKLAAATDKTMRQFDLLDALADVYGNMQPEALTEVISRLEAGGRIRVLERHRHGNHLIQLAASTK